MTRETTSFVYVTYIRATPERVFEAITRPEIARRYWGHANVSDWTPGARWEHVRDDAERRVDIACWSSSSVPARSSWSGSTSRAGCCPRR